MANNLILSPGTVHAINERVERILADLGNPEPPLRLEEVRELLRLDLKYYSSEDVTWLQEKIHKLRVAGKQVVARPALMLDVVKKLDLKGLTVPDKKRILIDSELPAPKQRWSEAHEVLHNVLPWHDSVARGDHKLTLSPTCHNQVESEANFGGGRLLFLGSRFDAELADCSALTFNTVKDLRGTFGNSLTTTLWRIVEQQACPALGLVSIHPQDDFEPGEDPIRYFVRSPAFATQFPDATGLDLYRTLETFCFRRRGPLGESEVVLTDASGQEHVFFLEAFHNGYDTLTLGTHRGLRSVVVAT